MKVGTFYSYYFAFYFRNSYCMSSGFLSLSACCITWFCLQPSLLFAPSSFFRCSKLCKMVSVLETCGSSFLFFQQVPTSKSSSTIYLSSSLTNYTAMTNGICNILSIDVTPNCQRIVLLLIKTSDLTFKILWKTLLVHCYHYLKISFHHGWHTIKRVSHKGIYFGFHCISYVFVFPVWLVILKNVPCTQCEYDL